MTNSLNLHCRKPPLLANQMAVGNEWVTREEYPTLLYTEKKKKGVFIRRSKVLKFKKQSAVRDDTVFNKK